MCLLLIAHQVREDYPLVLLANRDEFLNRPTAPLAFWDDAPDVLAGRDLSARGTWLGVSRAGRIAAVTNYREPGLHRADAESRGDLVTGFLISNAEPFAYLDDVGRRATHYNGFNLLAWRARALGYLSNRSGATSTRLGPGLFGLSNHLLDTPWPKVLLGKEKLRAALAESRLHPEALLDLVSATDVAPDNELPDTGMTLEEERALSAMFVRLDGYGTRSTSLILVNDRSQVDFYERTHDAAGAVAGVSHVTMKFEFHSE